MSSAPDALSVCWNPFAIARNARSTTTTSATAMTVESEIQNRCDTLLRFMSVTAAVCSMTERMFNLVRARWQSSAAWHRGRE